MPSVEPNEGLELMTLRSRPEPISKVRCLTDLTEPPEHPPKYILSNLLEGKLEHMELSLFVSTERTVGWREEKIYPLLWLGSG